MLTRSGDDLPDLGMKMSGLEGVEMLLEYSRGSYSISGKRDLQF